MEEVVTILGNWNDIVHIAPKNRMVLDAGHLAQHWRRVSLTADFWATYLALSAPPSASNERLNRDAVHGILSYLLNELFENCAKFSKSAIKTVYFESWKFEDQMIFQITNHIKPEAQPPLVDFLHTLLTGDPTELYFQRIEESAETKRTGSGLGFLSLMMDYGICFSFRFRAVDSLNVAIDVQAQVSMIK